jgi:hypothetical protein
MPFLPAIAAIASLAATGIGLGETLSNQPGAPKPPTTTPTQPTPAQQTTNRQQLEAAAVQQDPTLLAETGGYANPGYLASQSSLLSGGAGQPGGYLSALQGANQQFGINPAVARAFGLPSGPISGTSAATTPFTPAGAGSNNVGGPTGPTALSDFVNAFFRG